MMIFHRAKQAAHHRKALFLIRFVNLHGLEAPCQGRVFFKMLAVFRPRRGRDGPECAAGKCRLQKVGRIARSGSAAGSDQRMGFINEQDRRHDGTMDGINDRAQTFLEFAFHRRAGLKQAEIQRTKASAQQRGRNITGNDFLCKAFDDCRFADAGFAGQDRVVLAAAHQNVDDLANFFVPADDRIEFLCPRTSCEIYRELAECIFPGAACRERLCARFACCATGGWT